MQRRSGESEYAYSLRLAMVQGTASLPSVNSVNCRNDGSAFCVTIRATPLDQITNPFLRSDEESRRYSETIGNNPGAGGPNDPDNRPKLPVPPILPPNDPQRANPDGSQYQQGDEYREFVSGVTRDGETIYADRSGNRYTKDARGDRVVLPATDGVPTAQANRLGLGPRTDFDEMLGQNGTRTTSTRLLDRGRDGAIDVENPAPGRRPGQLHYQDPQGNKYYYDPKQGSFYDQATGNPAPVRVQNLLSRPDFQRAIRRGFQYLGI